MAKMTKTLNLFDKALNIVKKNWYLFLIGILSLIIFIIMYVNGGKLSGLVNLLSDVTLNYRKQVKTIDKLSEEKALKDKKVIEDNKTNLRLVRSKEQEELDKVETNKKKAIEELKKKRATELAKKMKDEFKL